MLTFVLLALLLAFLCFMFGIRVGKIYMANKTCRWFAFLGVKDLEQFIALYKDCMDL